MALAAGRELKPMLAKLTRELPREGYLYEPKWDRFRCLVFRDGSEVYLRSRHGRPLARYFPEVAAALLELEQGKFVVDGELVLERDGVFGFQAPSARVDARAGRRKALVAGARLRRQAARRRERSPIAGPIALAHRIGRGALTGGGRR